VWDPSENLWREGNGADWRIALLYYDEMLEEAVRAEAAEPGGTGTAAAASPSLSPSALRRFLDRFSLQAAPRYRL